MFIAAHTNYYIVVYNSKGKRYKYKSNPYFNERVIFYANNKWSGKAWKILNNLELLEKD